ncbi:MAG: hypothetical protein JNM56_29490 [Planctomycetia bacterium]|nr:hypothetical protein [Planctomycetia bacterium]
MSASIHQQIQAMLPALSRDQKVELARQLQQELADTTGTEAGPETADVARADGSSAALEAAFWNKLADDGVVESRSRAVAASAFEDFQPISVTGPSLSETIIENRR